MSLSQASPSYQVAEGWLKLSPEGFTLHSGQSSNWLIDASKFLEQPLADRVIRFWVQSLGVLREPIAVVGIATGGVKWAELLANALQTKAMTDGFWNQSSITRDLPWGSLVVVDDVATTGNSLKAVCPSVKTHYAVVVARGDIPDLHLHAWMKIHL